MISSWILVNFYYGWNFEKQISKTEFNIPIPVPRYLDIPVSSDKVEINQHMTNLQTDKFSYVASKKILLFTKYFQRDDFAFGFGSDPFSKFKCPVQNCFVSNNHSLMEMNEFDAIIFHPRSLHKDSTVLPDQKKRKVNQRYVMFMKESPMYDWLDYRSFDSKISLSIDQLKYDKLYV